MARPRSLKMSPDQSGVYHVLSRCTRRAFLLGGEHEHRKQWLVDELATLLPTFAIDLLGYAIMSNHLHLVLRSRPDQAAAWSPEYVACQGMAVMPIRTGIADGKLPVTNALVDRMSQQADWVSEYRDRLASISWLMRLVKQRVARRANVEDGCTGHFWESRFASVPLLDWGAILACMVYVDLNPHRAGIVELPERAVYCSIRPHLELSVKKSGRNLAQQVVPLTATQHFDVGRGCVPKAALTTEAYKAMIAATVGRRLHGAAAVDFEAILQQHGFDGSAWHEQMSQPGQFQSGAVGSHESRQRHAQRIGKKWIADKTGIWQ
jgi:hypothetical protein